MNAQSPTTRKTRIIFDLADELTPDEIRQFEQAAKDAGAPSLKEHFLNITLRVPESLTPKKAA